MVYNVAHFLVQQAIAQPTATAVRDPLSHCSDGSIAYAERNFAELEAESSTAAHYFSTHGIKRGSRVLLIVRPGLDLIRVVFALFKMGAVPIVIDPGMGFKKFLRCVRHSRPVALIGIPPAIWIARLFRPSFRGVDIKICVGHDFEGQIGGFKSYGAFEVVDSKEDEIAAILFTSGSTGAAKGVLYEHGMFLAQVEAIRHQYGIEKGEVDLPMLPVFALFNPALGMCTVVPDMNPSRPASVDPEQIVRAIQQNSVTNSFGSPALWTKVARHCERKSITLPTIRRILMAGAPVPPALMVKMRAIIPNGEIHTPYGATEALPVSSISATEVIEQTAVRTQKGEGTCVGRPLPNVFVRIVEPSDGAITSIEKVVDLPVGSVGEIIVKGASVTRGYDYLPEADVDSKILDDEGHWHRMGDMGWLDDLGRLWFCGRKVERVLTDVGAMYTDCCEAIYNTHPRVYRSALIDLYQGRPAIVIEPEKGAFPKSTIERKRFIESLAELGRKNAQTVLIKDFFFEANFPVDVRHNAKIHRLSLARKFARK